MWKIKLFKEVDSLFRNMKYLTFIFDWTLHWHPETYWVDIQSLFDLWSHSNLSKWEIKIFFTTWKNPVNKGSTYKVDRTKTKEECLKKLKGIMKELWFKEKETQEIKVSEQYDFKEELETLFDTSSQEEQKEIEDLKRKKVISTLEEKYWKDSTYIQKRLNKKTLNARVVLKDLGLEWDDLLFKDKWAKGYLIKFSLRFKSSKDVEDLKEKIFKTLAENNYSFNTKLTEKVNNLVLEVEFFTE